MHGSLPAAAAADPGRVLRAARKARRDGDAAAGAALVTDYLGLHPHDLPARVELGWCLWAAGQPADAVAAWALATQAHPRAAEPRMALVRAARATADATRARVLVDAVLADHPAHPDALVERILLLREAADPAGAERAARDALILLPHHQRCLLELARTLRAQGRHAEALGAFRDARRHEPARPGPLAEEARLLLELLQPEAALDLLATGDPADPALLLLRAEALRAMRRRPEAVALLAAQPAPSPRIAARIAIDRAALDRPRRFVDPHAPGAANSGAVLAVALHDATAAEIGGALRDATRAAHPLVTIAAAQALLPAASAPDARLAIAQAEADAHGTMGMQHSAIARLAAFAAEASTLPAPLRDRLALARAHAALGGGDWTGAASFVDAAPAPPALAAIVRALPGTPPRATCRDLLAGPATDPRLRAWIADQVAEELDPAGPLLGLAGMSHVERRIAEPLLRRNVALAHGRAADAAALLAQAFAAQGIAPPAMPDGFASLTATSAQPVDGPLVSIVVSAFDAAATLPAALASVLAQSWRNIEVLVVDDASTDGTGATIARIAAADPRVRPLAQRRNAGTYAARNLALRQVRGDFVTFHDSDDWMHPQRIATEMAAFADPRVLVANSFWFRVDAAGRAAFRPRAALAYANPSFAMFRSAALRRLGCYDHVRFSADTEMIWRARLVFGPDAIAVLPLTLAIGLSRPGSLTTSAATGMDIFGYSAPRTAYHEAWARWHQACDARGAVPHIAPDGPAPAHVAGLPDGMAALRS